MAVKPIYAVGLDAGSSRTRLVICALEHGRLRLLGSSSVESHGWLKGRIANQNEVAESVLAALREGELSAGVSVDSATVGLGGPTVRGANTRGAVELGFTREIEQRDVNRAVDRALKVQMPDDRMILQLFPQDCVVDGHPGHRDPRKMMASTLELNVHLLVGAVQEHHTLLGAVNQAHLMVEDTVFEAFASWYACVPEEDRKEGLAVVDIGSQSTEMVVYYGDAMQLSTSVPVCGDHFTRDLAQGLTLSFDDAELLKVDYGCAISHDTPENVFVELPTPDDRESRFARRKVVNGVLEARAEELFRFVRAELVRASMEHALVGGVYLTGGAARLPDLWDVAERELQCQAHYGLVTGVMNWPDSMKDPEWTTAAGLAMYSAKLKSQMLRTREDAGWIGRMLR
jgi:cell division protein FtsA